MKARHGLHVVIGGLLVALLVPSMLAADSPDTSIEKLKELVRDGKYRDAEPQARETLAAFKELYGERSAEVAEVLDVLVESLYRGGKGRAAETRELATLAVEIKIEALGPDHLDVAESLNNLAIVHYYFGEYAEAQNKFERALSIRTQVLGENHPDVADSLDKLVNLHQAIADYEVARELGQRALEIQEKSLGPEDPMVAKSLQNLATVLKSLGDYPEALKAAERALAIKEKTLGPEHPRLAPSLTTLGGVLWETGDYERALPLFERAIQIWENALGSDHPSLAAGLNNLAEQLVELGRYEEAKPLYERALAIWEKAYSPDHPRVALALGSLATLHLAMGENEKAQAMLERAVSIRQTALREDHPDLATSLNSLAAVLADGGEYTAARVSYERALDIRRNAFGSHHPVVAESLHGLAIVHTAGGDATRAAELALESEAIARAHLRLTILTLAEQHALHYAAVRSRGIDLALSLATQSQELQAPAFDSLIRSRAVVLDEMGTRNRAVLGAGDPEIAALAEELRLARSHLAHLIVKGVGRMNPPTYRGLLDEARDKKDRLERALGEASREFAEQQRQERAGLDEVRASLPADAALVAFVRHDRISFEQSNPPNAAGSTDPPVTQARRIVITPSYSAFVLRAQPSKLRLVSLGNAAELESLVARWKQEIASGVLRGTPVDAETRYRRIAENLRRKIWDPVEEDLGGAARAFIVPDGALNLVSFAALPTTEGHYLVEDGPLLHYLSAERDLSTYEATPDHGQGLLALGGPDHDWSPAKEASGHAGGTASQAACGDSQSAVRTRAACGDFDTLTFEPLPAAAKEVDDVAAAWQRARGSERAPNEQVVSLVGRQASEAAFKNRAPGRHVLHLATHGFFLGDDCVARAGSRGIGGLSEVRTRPSVELGSMSPLLLSGLALAGANRRAEATASEEDGVLTAEEIAGIDLYGIEWAVLSACDTGVGEVRAGEGVLGLRRAMRIAGVRTLIMSLWPVDDRSTREWMKALYGARLTRGMDTAASVRFAALDLLRRRRAKGEITHPFFWAAFVAAGDWR
jgi:CHAT domain-containing protein/tetratricopeptide (TPR) repeat protein